MAAVKLSDSLLLLWFNCTIDLRSDTKNMAKSHRHQMELCHLAQLTALSCTCGNGPQLWPNELAPCLIGFLCVFVYEYVGKIRKWTGKHEISKILICFLQRFLSSVLIIITIHLIHFSFFSPGCTTVLRFLSPSFLPSQSACFFPLWQKWRLLDKKRNKSAINLPLPFLLYRFLCVYSLSLSVCLPFPLPSLIPSSVKTGHVWWLFFLLPCHPARPI